MLMLIIIMTIIIIIIMMMKNWHNNNMKWTNIIMTKHNRSITLTITVNRESKIGTTQLNLIISTYAKIIQI